MTAVVVVAVAAGPVLVMMMTTVVAVLVVVTVLIAAVVAFAAVIAVAPGFVALGIVSFAVVDVISALSEPLLASSVHELTFWLAS